MATTPKILTLRPPKAPNLLIAPVAYSQLYIDQLNNALRLYFNQIDNFGAGLLEGTGGSAIKFPYFSGYQNGSTTLTANMTNVSTTPIQVTSTATFETSGFLIIEEEIVQYTGKTSTTFTGITRGVKSTTNVAHTAGVAVSEAAGLAAATPGLLKIDTVDFSNGITLTAPDSKLYFDVAGIYNIQFSAQALNWATTDDNVYLWFKKNGNNIAYTSGVEQINPKHGSNPGAAIFGWNGLLQVAAGDYFELAWATTSGNTVIATYPANGGGFTHPVSPSLILTATFVSAV